MLTSFARAVLRAIVNLCVRHQLRRPVKRHECLYGFTIFYSFVLVSEEIMFMRNVEFHLQIVVVLLIILQI